MADWTVSLRLVTLAALCTVYQVYPDQFEEVRRRVNLGLIW
jgi:hypothetical protein